MYHFFADRSGAPAKPGGDPPEKPGAVPAVIDVHVHLVNPGLVGVPLAAAPDGTPLDGPARDMARGAATAATVNPAATSRRSRAQS